MYIPSRSLLLALLKAAGMYSQGINVFQDARLLTMSWPYWPKINNCVEELARQRYHHPPLQTPCPPSFGNCTPQSGKRGNRTPKSHQKRFNVVCVCLGQHGGHMAPWLQALVWCPCSHSRRCKGARLGETAGAQAKVSEFLGAGVRCSAPTLQIQPPSCSWWTTRRGWRSPTSLLLQDCWKSTGTTASSSAYDSTLCGVPYLLSPLSAVLAGWELMSTAAVLAHLDAVY